MQTIHIWPQETKRENGQIVSAARIESQETWTIWFRVPEEFADEITNRAETFVAATLLQAMSDGADLRVHAPLSPSFLRNVEEFQAIWSCWDQRLRTISILADDESEAARGPQVGSTPAPIGSTPSLDESRAIAMFSGGVDSCYTAWRHTQKLCGRRALSLQSALLVHGVDSGRNKAKNYDTMFAEIQKRYQIMLAELDVRLIPLTTNMRDGSTLSYPQKTFGSLLAACLLLFQESHSHGLIPASFSYHRLVLPLGSTPLTDPLWGTKQFAIEHDGALASRAQKLREIVSWPAVLENLRVCNQVEFADRNCGRCEKCVRNILNLRVIGVQNAPCFHGSLSNATIRKLRLRGTDWEAMSRVLLAARGAKISNSWVNTLEKTLRREKMYEQLEPARERVKQTLPSSLRSKLRTLKTRRRR